MTLPVDFADVPSPSTQLLSFSFIYFFSCQDSVVFGNELVSCSHVHLLLALRYCGHGHCRLHLQIHWIQRVSPPFSCTITFLQLATCQNKFCLFSFFIVFFLFSSLLCNLQSAMCGLQRREGVGRWDPWFVTKCSTFCSYSPWRGSTTYKKLEVLKVNLLFNRKALVLQSPQPCLNWLTSMTSCPVHFSFLSSV